MKILLTNDDGIYAPGLLALKRELEILGDVYAVAPDRPRSATGHSITLHKPLRVSRIELADGSTGYATNGTPSDCIVLALAAVLDDDPDLVVSGINPGPNLGEDLSYSGTVSAAMEGAICGFPSFAISLAGEDVFDFHAAAKFAVRLASKIHQNSLPKDMLLNVNVPALPEGEIAGVSITRQAKRRYRGRIETRIDPRGREYYWLGGELLDEEPPEGTDVDAIQHNQISVTPIQLDFTEYRFMDELRTWQI